MKIAAKDPDAYVAAVPPERRPHVEKLRALIKKSVPKAREGIVWGMLGFSIDERPFAALASHKSYLSLYLMDLYTQPGLRDKHEAALSKLAMGKSCINFQSVDELPLRPSARSCVRRPTSLSKGARWRRCPKPRKAPSRSASDRRTQLYRGFADNLPVRNFHLNLNPRTDTGAENLATVVTVGVPLVNLFVAGYLFVSALVSASDGGEMSVSTGWAVAASASSGVLLATVLFWLASRARRVDRVQSQRRAAAARRVLARPVPSAALAPPSVTVVVRRPGSQAV